MLECKKSANVKADRWRRRNTRESEKQLPVFLLIRSFALLCFAVWDVCVSLRALAAGPSQRQFEATNGGRHHTILDTEMGARRSDSGQGVCGDPRLSSPPCFWSDPHTVWTIAPQRPFPHPISRPPPNSRRRPMRRPNYEPLAAGRHTPNFCLEAFREASIRTAATAWPRERAVGGDDRMIEPTRSGRSMPSNPIPIPHDSLPSSGRHHTQTGRPKQASSRRARLWGTPPARASPRGMSA